MIQIGRPQIINTNNKARLEASIDIDGNKNVIWFEVDEKYGKYLCYERTDAFVIGILNYAMRNGHDITCEAPIGEELYYQITTYLIDAVYKGSTKLHKTIIYSEIDSSKLISANAVGTGISCGIDSLHVLAQQTNTRFPNLNVTHLAFNNVGSHGEGELAQRLFNERKTQAESFAKEFGFELIESNSNIMDTIPQNHFLSHTYTSTFAIYALQKLYSVYYYASGRTFFAFSLDDTLKDCSYYDLLLACTCSTSSLTIHSEGGTLSRFEKTKQVVTYHPSYKYLNVCTKKSYNCGKCEKCTRTLLALDALNKLDSYNKVFDIKYYKKHRQDYYAQMIKYTIIKNKNYSELLPLLKNRISPIAIINGIAHSILPLTISLMPKFIKNIIKKIIYRT